MRGRSLRRRAPLALLLGLGLAAVPLATPAQANCIEFTMYVNWHGTDPTGRPTTPVHNGCVTEGIGDGTISLDRNTNLGGGAGTPSSIYLYIKVPMP